MKILISAAIFLLLSFPSAALGVPFLHTPQPPDNTFVAGGSQTFSINATSANLNSSSVILYIISLNAYQQGESWDNHALSCVNTSSEWKCTKSISFVIAGSDTVELFYFEASDTDNTKGNNGTASSPLRFTLDRNPPTIVFVNPENNSYVGLNRTISLTVTDVSSGVNSNSVQYSTNDSSWTTLSNASSSSFEAIWNTTAFSNNQTVTIYSRASDNVKNNGTANINVTVDNEIPQIIVVSNLSGTLSGNVQIRLNVSDNFSGINLGNVRYAVGGLGGTLGCTGGNYVATCSAVLNTANLQDGNHTLNFTVSDRAGNSNSSSVQIETTNTYPTISIVSPAKNVFVNGPLLVRSAVVNAKGVVKYVEVAVTGADTTTKNMTCDPTFSSCNYSFDTTAFIDGGYAIRVNAVNSLNLDVSASTTVTIDNTKPKLTILQPGANVTGDFEIKVEVIDTNLNQNKVGFEVSSSKGNMTCTAQTPTTYICSTVINSNQLSDGKHQLRATAEDKAGNSVAEAKEINIGNKTTMDNATTEGGGSAGATGSAGAGRGGGAEAGGTEVGKEGKQQGFPFFKISLPFKPECVIIGVIGASVAIVVIVLAIAVKTRLSKGIITE